MAMTACLTLAVGTAIALPLVALSGGAGIDCGEARTLDERLAIDGKHFGAEWLAKGRHLSDRELLPFDTIEFERTPCFGDCPIYHLTMHADGRAELDDHTPGHQGRFLGDIDLATFARLVQLGRRAQRVTDRDEYMGGWTDDYWSIVTLRGRAGVWRVGDNGEVAPVELWALHSLLHVQYERIAWTPR
jgi:hypothetical protein